MTITQPNLRKLIVRIAVGNIVLLVAVYYWVLYPSRYVEDADQSCNTAFLEKNLVGKRLPKFEFVDTNSSDVYPKLVEGKVLMIVFNTSCHACMSEFDLIERHYDEIAAHTRVAAVSGEPSESVEQFAEERRPLFPLYVDVRAALMLKSRVACTPTMLFLENGIVRKISVGISKNYRELIEED